MTRLSEVIPHLVLGGAGWSSQISNDPDSMPVLDTIIGALDLGIRAFDTSPYYHPSEILLGKAFSHPQLLAKYKRSDFILMTKCGRIAAEEFDYSRQWVGKSVERSLDRFQTDYLDVVFCHDVEYVTEEEVFEAVGTLLELKEKGKIRYVGISGYPLPLLAQLAAKIRDKFGRPVDCIQSYCHFTIMNTTLYTKHLPEFIKAGVDCVFNASPLSMGLLRAGGVPVGKLGSWHPAPNELCEIVKEASDWVESQGDNLASVALRYAIGKGAQLDTLNHGITIIGGGNIEEIKANIDTARQVLKPALHSTTDHNHTYDDARDLQVVDDDAVTRDEDKFKGVRNILKDWLDFSWESPGKNWPEIRAAKKQQSTGN